MLGFVCNSRRGSPRWERTRRVETLLTNETRSRFHSDRPLPRSIFSHKKAQNREMTWEERWHPLREEWVIVAAHRQDRPWIGSTITRSAPELPEYVADC